MSSAARALYLLQVIGIALVAFGWMLESSEHLAFVRKVVAPDYFRTVAAYEHALGTGEPLTPADDGFEEVLSATLSGSLGEVAEITFGEPAYTVFYSDGGTGPIGTSAKPTVAMTVVLSDGRVETLDNMPDPRKALHEELLQTPMFRTGSVLFWVGLVLSFIVLILQVRSEDTSTPSDIGQPTRDTNQDPTSEEHELVQERAPPQIGKLHERATQSSRETRQALVTLSTAGIGVFFFALTTKVDPPLTSTQQWVVVAALVLMASTTLTGLLAGWADAGWSYAWARELESYREESIWWKEVKDRRHLWKRRGEKSSQVSFVLAVLAAAFYVLLRTLSL